MTVEGHFGLEFRVYAGRLKAKLQTFRKRPHYQMAGRLDSVFQQSKLRSPDEAVRYKLAVVF